MSIVDIYERIFVLVTCYFTIATELRLISLKKSIVEKKDEYFKH